MAENDADRIASLYLEDVSALVVLDRPPVSLEDLGDLLLPEDAEEPVHEDLEPHWDGVSAVEDEGGQLEDGVSGDGHDAGGAAGVERAQCAQVGVVAGRRGRGQGWRVRGGERVAAAGCGCCGSGGGRGGGPEVVAQAELVQGLKEKEGKK